MHGAVTMHITVETYQTLRGTQLPRRFQLDGRSVDVTEIVDQWPGRDHVYFKVKGADNNLYILRLNENDASWEMTLFETPHAEEIASHSYGRPRRGDGAA